MRIEKKFAPDMKLWSYELVYCPVKRRRTGWCRHILLERLLEKLLGEIALKGFLGTHAKAYIFPSGNESNWIGSPLKMSTTHVIIRVKAKILGATFNLDGNIGYLFLEFTCQMAKRARRPIYEVSDHYSGLEDLYGQAPIIRGTRTCADPHEYWCQC